MVQIIEVLIAVVISAMMATAISTLALSPIKTQRQKSIYATSEAAAIAVRRCAVGLSPPITKPKIESDCLVSINRSTDVQCTVIPDYPPPGGPFRAPLAVVCKQVDAAAGSSGEAWQPLPQP